MADKVMRGALLPIFFVLASQSLVAFNVKQEFAGAPDAVIMTEAADRLELGLQAMLAGGRQPTDPQYKSDVYEILHRDGFASLRRGQQRRMVDYLNAHGHDVYKYGPQEATRLQHWEDAIGEAVHLQQNGHVRAAGDRLATIAPLIYRQDERPLLMEVALYDALKAARKEQKRLTSRRSYLPLILIALTAAGVGSKFAADAILDKHMQHSDEDLARLPAWRRNLVQFLRRHLEARRKRNQFVVKE